MENMTAQPETELRALIGVASQIARCGYGEPIVDLALRRKGVTRDAAWLIAASVVSCHATLVQAEEQARREQARSDAAPLASAADPLDQAPQAGQPLQTMRIHEADGRSAGAAGLALRKMASFAVFIVIGLGGGAALGWSAGFNLGIEDGFDWIVRVVERRISGSSVVLRRVGQFELLFAGAVTMNAVPLKTPGG